MTRLPWKIATLFLGGLTVCLPAGVLEAQSLSQVDQAQQVQRVLELQSPAPPLPVGGAVPSLYPGEEEDTGRQLLLETTPRQRWNWIDVSVDSQYFYTSNAALSKTGERGTGLLVSTILAEVDVPPFAVPGGQLFTRAGYQYQWFDYGIGGPGDGLSELDFDVATTFLEGQYQLPDQWCIFANVSYTRLLNDGDGYDEFYKEVVPTLRLEKTLQIGNNLQFTAGYSGNYRFSDEAAFPGQSRDSNNRTDQALTLVLNWSAAPKVDIRPFYRFQYSYYPDYLSDQSRNDFLHTLGVSADYHLNSWSVIRFFLTYEIRDSDSSSSLDYRKLDAGGGLSVGLKF